MASGLWLVASGITVFSLFGSVSLAQTSKASLAERLGYGPQDKLLIVHVDDIGSFESANFAARDAFKAGVARSGSVMLPAPEARSARAILPSDMDLGVHVTLSTDFKHKPCLPSAGEGAVPSLVDWTGAFTGNLMGLAFASSRDVEIEIGAQVQRALELGYSPTHMDTHVGTVFFRPSWMNAYLNIARKYRIPPMVPRWSEATRRPLGFWGSVLSVIVTPLLNKVEEAGFLLLDDFYMLPPPSRAVSYEKRKAETFEIIRNLKPGVSQIVFHPAYASGDFEKDALAYRPTEIFRDHEARLLQDPELHALIEKEGIKLITWREISSVYPWHQTRDL